MAHNMDYRLAVSIQNTYHFSFFFSLVISDIECIYLKCVIVFLTFYRESSSFNEMCMMYDNAEENDVYVKSIDVGEK